MRKHFWAKLPPKMNGVSKMEALGTTKPADCWSCHCWENLGLSWPRTDGTMGVWGAKSQHFALPLSSLLFSSNLLHFLLCDGLGLVRQLLKASSPSPPLITYTYPCVPAVNCKRPSKHRLRKFKQDVKQFSNLTASQETVEKLSLQDAPHENQGWRVWGHSTVPS